MRRKRYPSYLDRIGHGNLCAKSPADYVAMDIADPKDVEGHENEESEREEEETPDVVDMMNGRER